MPRLRSVPPLVLRTMATGVGGSALLWLGWKALGGSDAGSALMAFPLMSIGTTLVMVALGAGWVAFARFRRGERLSPLPAEPTAPAPLPRAIARTRR